VANAKLLNEYKLNQDKLLRDKKNLMENHQKVLVYVEGVEKLSKKYKDELKKAQGILNT